MEQAYKLITPDSDLLNHNYIYDVYRSWPEYDILIFQQGTYRFDPGQYWSDSPEPDEILEDFASNPRRLKLVGVGTVIFKTNKLSFGLREHLEFENIRFVKDGDSNSSDFIELRDGVFEAAASSSSYQFSNCSFDYETEIGNFIWFHQPETLQSLDFFNCKVNFPCTAYTKGGPLSEFELPPHLPDGVTFRSIIHHSVSTAIPPVAVPELIPLGNYKVSSLLERIQARKEQLKQMEDQTISPLRFNELKTYQSESQESQEKRPQLPKKGRLPRLPKEIKLPPLPEELIPPAFRTRQVSYQQLRHDYLSAQHLQDRSRDTTLLSTLRAGFRISIDLEAYDFNLLVIHNGHMGSEELYKAYRRIKYADILLDQRKVMSIELADSFVPQGIDLSPIMEQLKTAHRMTLKVTGIYEGKTSDLLAVSGVYGLKKPEYERAGNTRY